MLGKDIYAYVSFPNRPIKMREMPLQAVLAKPHLTFAMPAVVTLPATFFINHRVATTLLTEITRDTQMAQT
jgi:hypothetical protein